MLLLCAFASSAHASDELLERPETLRGASASWEVVFRGSGAARVDLRYEASELLSTRSLISVELDGVPRATRPLRPLGRMVVALGHLDEGFHRLTVRSHAQVSDDPCLHEFADEAWVRLDAASLRGIDDATEENSVLDWLGERTGEKMSVRVGPAMGRLDPDWASAILDAHGTLWRRGIVVAEDAEATLALRIGPPGDGVAHVAIEGADLVVTATGPATLAEGLRALREDGVLRRCPVEGCELSPLQKLAPGALEAESEVIRLEELGFARGWRATGEGRHVLRFGWDRPADWRPQEWPRVDLSVRVPEAGIDHERSRATLAVNDVPLASWTLEPGESRWRGRIPRELWSDGRWEMTLAVTLRSSDDEGCHEDDEDVWVHVAGDSSLHVPRDELEFAGLASALNQFRGAPLVWNEGLDVAALGALAAALSPLADATPWTWLPPTTECRERCIQLGSGRWWETGSRLELVGEEGARKWRDDSGELGIPLIPAEGTLLLERRDERTLRMTALGSAPELTPPQWTGLLGEVALFHDGGWDVLAVDDEPTIGRSVEAEMDEEPSQASIEESHVHWVDMFFSAFAGLVLLGVAWSTLRRRRTSDRTSEEMG